MNKASKLFEVSLQGSHALQIPQKIAEGFSSAGHTRVLVKATLEEKEVSFHAALQKRMGDFYITFGKRLQKQLGVYPSDYFMLQLYEDTSKYGVEMPKEMEAVFESDADASELFERFTDGKKRSLIYHVLRIKDPQKRIDRSLTISENIKRGITNNSDIVKPL